MEKGEKLITLPTYHSKKNNIEVSAVDNISIYMSKNEDIDEDKIAIDYSGVNILNSDNKKGDIIGKAHVFYGEKYVGDVDIVLEEDVPFSIFSWSKDNLQYILIAEICLIGIILIIYKKYYRNKKELKYAKYFKI